MTDRHDADPSGRARVLLDPAPRRRAVLLGAAGLAVAVVPGSSPPGAAGGVPSPVAVRLPEPVGGVRELSSPVVVGPRPVSEVLQEARASAGARLLGSPWEEGADASGWSARWVAWLLRGEEAFDRVVTPADLLAAIGRAGTDVPAAGAVAFRSTGPDAAPGAVGLVVSVIGGAAQTLEGDHPSFVPGAERFVRWLPGPGAGTVSYVLPGYAS